MMKKNNSLNIYICKRHFSSTNGLLFPQFIRSNKKVYKLSATTPTCPDVDNSRLVALEFNNQTLRVYNNIQKDLAESGNPTDAKVKDDITEKRFREKDAHATAYETEKEAVLKEEIITCRLCFK